MGKRPTGPHRRQRTPAKEQVSIERVTRLSVFELTPLMVESRQAGLRLLERLLDEWLRGGNRFNRPGEALWIAREDRRVVGVCGLNIDPYVNSRRVGRVRRLYVSMARRRRGIGRQLVERLITAARGTFGQLRLRTSNPAAARFYETLGFRRLVGGVQFTHVLNLEPNDRVMAARRVSSTARASK